jgi:hypothetical protein
MPSHDHADSFSVVVSVHMLFVVALCFFFFRRIIFFFFISSRVSFSQHLSPWLMRVDHV